MFCTQCGTQCKPGDCFCTECGAAVFESEPAFGRDHGKTGRLWVPIVLMVLMAVVGLGAFFIYRGYTDYESPWFTVRNHILYYDAAAYDGNGKIKAPSQIQDQAVEQISAYCFSSATGITSIEISEGILYVGDYAFAECTDLVSVKLPQSVKELGYGLFYNCEKLEAVYIPGTVEYIGYEPFTGCTNLQYVFFSGTARQWEALYIEPLPENAVLYVDNGQGYVLYETP